MRSFRNFCKYLKLPLREVKKISLIKYLNYSINVFLFLGNIPMNGVIIAVVTLLMENFQITYFNCRAARKKKQS